ncbi:MAG: PAS domain-containing protein [Chlorobaculum sp.]|nr:PAS domain-containing protein [Chlorobaculum sp.]
MADGLIAALERKIAMLESRVSTAEQSAEALEAALETAQAGWWEWDLERDTFRINKRWAAMTGHAPGEFDALTIEKWRELCHPDDLGAITQSLDGLLNGGAEILELALRVLHKSGEWIRVLDRGKITRRDQNGKPLCLAGSRQALDGECESQAQKAHEELQALIDNIPGAIYHIDATGKATIRSKPPEFLKALAADHHGTPLIDTFSMIHQDDRNMVAEAYSKLKEGKKSLTLIYRIVTPDGALHWIEDHMRSSFQDDGHYEGLEGLLCEVTERVASQEENRRLESQLRKAQRLETIGTLAGGIAHDFNNILTPILGYSEMGLSSIGEDDPMHEYFSEIMLAAERAQKLVAQILTFSKAEEGKGEQVSIQEVIAEAIQLLRPSLPSTISIEEEIDSSCRKVFADPTQMHQVVVNLCTNAFHAMEETGGVLRIGLREVNEQSAMPSTAPKLPEGDYIELSVSDSGTGMDETTIERIFEPFFTTKSIEKGAGLGLSVVHGIVAAANGQLNVESNQGKGSTFHVYLPIVENKPVAKAEEKPQAAKYAANVLFIDDEPAAIHMVTIMMTKLGYNIRAENSPLEALKLFRKQPDQFDLIITDLTMPDMTGLQLTTELHKISPSIPVILMTGYGKIIDHDTPLRHYGINRLLKKPVKLAQLASAVNEVLSSTNPTEVI